jgi:ubiquinone/menaquinone biosynthesis C-methylase UbiE
MRTLNIGAGKEDWGTDKLDNQKYHRGIKFYDFNSGKKLPFKDGIFDEVRLHGVLEFMVDPQFIIEECHRVMKSNAMLSIVTVNIESLRFYLRPFRGQVYTGEKKMFENGAVISPMSFHLVEMRLKRAGFKVIWRGRKSDVWPFQDNVRIRAVKIAK